MLTAANANRMSDSVLKVARVMGPCERITEQNAMSPKVRMPIGLRVL